MSNLDAQRSLVNVMVTMSAADRSMTDEELSKIGNLIQSMPVFIGYEMDNLIDDARACSEILNQEDGLEIVINDCLAKVPERLYETAYAMAVDVAAADLTVEQEELRLLAMLRDAMQLDRLTCAAIERGARARHAKL